MLHHLARSERLYAAALDEALPDEDPERRGVACAIRLPANDVPSGPLRIC